MSERVQTATKKPEAKRENKSSQTQKTGHSQSISSPVDQILFLQRTIGNQAVGKLIKSGILQAKLRIGQPGDIYEQEADRVAEQVMRMPEPQVSTETKVSDPARNNTIQRKCPMCNKGTKIEKEENLQKKEASGSTHEVTPELESSINAVRGGGQPLTESMRAFYEPRFSADFSGVRVHTDAKAAEAARAVNARAFTAGRDVGFGKGEFAPATTDGMRLIAHELTHVMQQAELKHAVKRKNSPGHGVELQLEAKHPVSKPTPEEYIKTHTGLFGLNEKKLASDMLLLSWQSADHYNFIIEIFNRLRKSDQTEVAQFFFEQLGDELLKEFALTPTGRTFITSIGLFLPKDSRQRKRVTEIILAGPQEEREKERKESIEKLKKKGKTVDITFFTSYKGMDMAEALLESIAKGRESRKATNAAFPMEEFEDIGIYLGEIARQTGAKDFTRELHLMGHGAENNFGFGRYFYSSDDLRKNYKTGLHTNYMTNGASIYMEGCNVAKGEAGLKYLKEIGRIFFGDKKSGFIKGNTCKTIGIMEMTECGPLTLRWPSDFK